MNEDVKTVAADSINVKVLPDMLFAYVSHIGPYKGDVELFAGLYGKIMEWAGPRNLIKLPEKMLTVYHDDPDVTDEKNLRLSVGITVPENTEVSGEMSKMTIKGGEYVVAHYEVSVDEIEDAWKNIYSKWFPESGYQPAEGVCFEVGLNDPNEHPEHKYIFEICIPVKPI